MSTETAKMAVSTLKLETILIQDTVLQEAIKKLNAMNRESNVFPRPVNKNSLILNI